ncbi:biotin/lipoyl-containing protein [Endozoicomonas sp. SCSIO W0465]|uniref:biotin/lipoyl-containing protein n=1 Tax=Endozoicomonas sp. SCSIO W0465 TaxID=2918516 RepID=UPI0020756780|nr:biotin/lipoyl-containing protein [Endozoicomonas sp. SCSIO W0465]USE35958.1 hypothetical protein MJO57_28515 [Endozoicomonas sp. SCSIO W0465]
MNEFYLPDLGEGIANVEIAAWHIAPGEHIQMDQNMVTVVTDKAIVDIPAPYTGRIRSIHGAVNDTIVTGSLLVEYETIDAPRYGYNPEYDL